ncbi:MAG: nitroreductase [Bacteroidetes bacterium]|jgi:nitroreductase|nr:nitroreductase [Bacteroidota bacterium]MDF1866113.1 nitroreductase [Saprospiraceae bacterium]
MKATPEQINELIRRRRSIFPKMYNGKPIPKEIIEEVLENANWAPTHRLTEPWRFKIFRGSSLKNLAEYSANYYKEHTPPEKYQETKYQKTLKKPTQSDCVIALCMKRDEKERIPEWEEVASLACAVQNMWLTCTAYGVGCYWSSPKSALEGRDIFNLKTGEKCYGLFYMGYHDLGDIPAKRSPIENKVEWMEE